MVSCSVCPTTLVSLLCSSYGMGCYVSSCSLEMLSRLQHKYTIKLAWEVLLLLKFCSGILVKGLIYLKIHYNFNTIWMMLGWPLGHLARRHFFCITLAINDYEEFLT